MAREWNIWRSQEVNLLIPRHIVMDHKAVELNLGGKMKLGKLSIRKLGNWAINYKIYIELRCYLFCDNYYFRLWGRETGPLLRNPEEEDELLYYLLSGNT